MRTECRDIKSNLHSDDIGSFDNLHAIVVGTFRVMGRNFTYNGVRNFTHNGSRNFTNNGGRNLTHYGDRNFTDNDGRNFTVNGGRNSTHNGGRNFTLNGGRNFTHNGGRKTALKLFKKGDLSIFNLLLFKKKIYQDLTCFSKTTKLESVVYNTDQKVSN